MEPNPPEKPRSRQAIQAETASKPGKVTGKLAVAVDLMIEQGLPWEQAALQAGITVRSMRLALSRPHVIRHIKEAREVFRQHVSAANIHRARELRDQDDNKMASISAMRFIEGLGDDAPGGSAAKSLPGLQIVVVTGNASVPTINAQPDAPVTRGPAITIDNDDKSNR
jgi:hypothetical protein